MKTYLLLAACLVAAFNPAYADRVTIAIGEIEYRAKDSMENKRYAAYGSGAREDTRAFIDMLTTSLVKAQKFDVIERDRMAEILKEQGLSMEGIARDGFGGREFAVQGVDYIVTGAITEYGETASDMKVAGFSSKKRIATMAVDVRILDVATGSVAIAETVKAEARGGSSVSIRGFKSGGDSSSAGLLGKVMRETSTNVANVIVSSIYPVRVVSVVKSGAEVVLNYGEGFLNKGDVLEIYSEGEELIDPDTGESLGSDEELIGSVSVYKTQAKFSRVTVDDGRGSIEQGMVARPVVAPRESESKR